VLAVLFIDLNGFKRVNDELGHQAGDRVLEIAARRIRSAARPSDLCGRWGGDEFVVVCERLPSAAIAERIGARLEAALGEPIAVGGQMRTIVPSIGTAVACPGLTDPAQLVAAADADMYRSRRSHSHPRWTSL
jgi:diguanylate cyclase (GGDEF)-like protein